MKKRFLSIILSLSMCLILLPAEVWAADSHDIPELGIGTSSLSSNTYYLIGEDGSVTTTGADENEYNIYYASETRILTLQNAALTKRQLCALWHHRQSGRRQSNRDGERPKLSWDSGQFR